MESNKKPSVNEAKANFAASIDGLRPIEAATEAHPLLLLGVAVVIGAIVGRSNPKILKRTGMLAATTLLSSSLTHSILKKLFHIDMVC